MYKKALKLNIVEAVQLNEWENATKKDEPSVFRTENTFCQLDSLAIIKYLYTII